MNQKEIQQTIDRYNQRLQQYGITEKALGWGDKGRSKLRFEILCSEWDFNGKTILDFGCGFGDLYPYIKETRTSDFKYVGIDLNPAIIEIAKSKNYDHADFYLVGEDPREVLDKLDLKFDYVISSGIFNATLDNNIGFIKNTLDIFYAYAQAGFATNFLSDKVDFKSEANYHSNPAEILDICYRYGNNVILKNNYMPFEFTVFVNKKDPIDKSFNVYQSFLKYV